jgi:hypothetical protein
MKKISDEIHFSWQTWGSIGVVSRLPSIKQHVVVSRALKKHVVLVGVGRWENPDETGIQTIHMLTGFVVRGLVKITLQPACAHPQPESNAWHHQQSGFEEFVPDTKQISMNMMKIWVDIDPQRNHGQTIKLNKKQLFSKLQLSPHLFSIEGLFGEEQLLGSLLSWQANIVQPIV